MIRSSCEWGGARRALGSSAALTMLAAATRPQHATKGDLMRETDRLLAYAKRTALELRQHSAALDCLPITSFRTTDRRSGFLGMRRLEVRVAGPDELVPIGWLLWSHVWKEVEAYGSSGNPKRPRAGLTHTWTITEAGGSLPRARST